MNDSSDMKSVLNASRTIAIIGLSPDETRPSNSVAKYLIEKGYQVVGVHPHEQSILGCPCYTSLSEVPFTPDIIDVFRKSEAIPEIVDDVIKKGAKVLWLQEGVFHPAAEARGKSAGIKIFSNVCIAKELRKLA